MGISEGSAPPATITALPVDTAGALVVAPSLVCANTGAAIMLTTVTAIRTEIIFGVVLSLPEVESS